MGLPTHGLERPSSTRTGLAMFGIWLALTGVLAAGCGGKGPANVNAGGPTAMPVQVLPVPAQTIEDTTEYLSIMKSRHSATINPQVEGYVTKIFVKSGDRVQPGEALLQIDPLKQESTLSSQESARAAQEATMRLAKVNLERAKKLSEAGVISKSDLDNAQTNYDSSVSQLKSLEQLVQQQTVELHYYKVSAPMAGIVGDIPVRTGDRVTVSTMLTTVDEPGALEAYIYVPASRAHDLKLGLPVKFLDENGGVRGESKITFVSPQVDSDTQTVLAKAAVGNAKDIVRISQQLRTRITWGSRQGPVVPVLAVTRINGQFFVFVAMKEGNSTVARQKVLKLGEIIGNNYAVLDGLKPGEHLIISGTQFLQDGMPVAEQIAQAADGSTGKTEPGAKAN
jgi:RND family efflux transporter MFP subunit